MPIDKIPILGYFAAERCTLKKEAAVEKIVRFGHSPWCHWFVRRDGARFYKFSFWRYSFIVARGLEDIGQIDPRHVVGYYFDSETNRSMGMILHQPGRDFEERVFLAYAEPSERFDRWFERLAG